MEDCNESDLLTFTIKRMVGFCEIGGNRKALERVHPKIEFAWPATSDPNSVFILQRAQLPG